MNIVKNIGAVLAGFLTVVLLSTGTDAVLEALKIFPPVSDQGLFVTWMLALALAYRTAYTVLGGYVTAHLAPQKPMRLVYILGVLGTLGGLAGVAAGWNLSEHWYPIALAVLAFPSVWFGGYLHGKMTGTAAKDGASAWKPIKGSAQEITITRLFDANRQKIWDAWTKPEYLSQWFGVPPVAATRETTSIDLRVGGGWRADMVNAQTGDKMPFAGKYLEIKSPEKLVFTIEQPGAAEVETVTIILKDRIGVTEMLFTQKGHLPPEQYGDPLRSGYNAFFERMIGVVQQMR